MQTVRFKDLVMDAPRNDAARHTAFWASVLGSTTTEGPKGYRVDARPGAPTATQLWINPVDEPRAAKTRVHLDLRLPERDVAPLVALGARIVSEPGVDPWWVLADPDGNLFCAFPPRDGEHPATGAPAAPFELVVDAGDALAAATWWATQLGGEVKRSEDKGYCWIEGAAGFPWESWVFDPVPEPKTVKNRVHWDVTLVGNTGPDALVEAGATLHRSPDGDVRWWILTDPAGNEFCAFPPDE